MGLTSEAAAPPLKVTFSLRIRVPGWLVSKPSVEINGEAWGGAATPASYMDITREWQAGDTVVVAFPPTLWTAPLNDHHAWHNATVAFMYGPLVL